MGAIDQNLIERYLANEMTTSERHTFEQRIAADEDLRLELAEYQVAMDALKLAQREELKNRFKERDKILDRKGRKGSGGRNRTLLALSAVAFLALLLGWKFFSSAESQSDKRDGITKDTMIIEQPPVIRPDSSITPKIEKEPREKPKPSATRGKDLFAAHFEPFLDETMDPVSRSGDEQLTAFEMFQLYYTEKKYRDADATFRQMEPAYQQNDNLRFFYANVLLALNRAGEAIPILEAISKNLNSHYAIESLYYLALAHLTRQELSAARNYLQLYLNNAHTAHAADAQRLLGLLN